MGPPVLEWFESATDEAPLARWHYGGVDQGDESQHKTFFVFNNKDGSGAATATGIRYTTYDDFELREAEPVVTGKWLSVRLLSHNGESVQQSTTAVGGSGSANQYDLSAHPLANGEYLELRTVYFPAADAPVGLHRHCHAVHYSYT